MMSQLTSVDSQITGWPAEVGRRVRLPQSRRLVNDLLHFSRKIPAHTIVRHCSIPNVVAARHRLKTDCRLRISWPVLFAKAFAWVAIRHAPRK